MLYDYECKSCKKQFEVSHGMNEKPAVICPECSAECKKVFSANGIIFKGSGWYVTDSNGSSAKADSGEKE